MYFREPAYRELGEPVAGFDGTALTRSLQGFAEAPPTLPPSAWQDLISFRPPDSVQKIVFQKRTLIPPTPAWFFHRIEDGVGPVNLDYYPVQVTRLPQVEGVTLTPAAFLTHIRRKINDFVDQRLVYFRPRATADHHVWNSEYIYAAQHTLWMSFQNAIKMFVSNHRGEATVLPPIANRYDWTTVSAQYHRPTQLWLPG